MVVEDSDGDGNADRSHPFVTEKEIRHAPLGIAVFDNQIVLSATPSIIVYTDVDRDTVFDPNVDKREVFLTGFQNKNHDHTVHAVVGAPSGQWHFSFGNCGADIKTKDGRHYLAGCYYGYPEAIGKKSWDGEVYVGGMTMRINPDGTGLEPTGENMRNPHDMFVTSQGDIFQSDNDDPAHCRSSWVMEHANMGYADLRDGSRSWEEVAKTWEDHPGGIRVSAFHVPIGGRTIQDPSLQDPFMVLVHQRATSTSKMILSDLPVLISFPVWFERKSWLVSRNLRERISTWVPTSLSYVLRHQRKDNFLPTDVALAPDGTLL